MTHPRYRHRPRLPSRIVGVIGGVFALLEGSYALLLVAGADQSNAGFRFVARYAEPLALFFPGLFTLDEPKLTVIVTYGAAALFWLALSGFLARMLA